MKKFVVFLVCLLVAGGAFAAGENIATSKAHVDTAVAQKQDAIPANDGTAQVLTNTGTPGSVGTKNIYDSTGTYATQTDALVTAGDFNTAVQSAVDTEFECIQYNANGECLLVKIRDITELPSGYTQLEYIESTGTQYIDTMVIPTANFDIYIEGMMMGNGVLLGTTGISLLATYHTDTVLARYISGESYMGGIGTGGIGNKFYIALSPHRQMNYRGREIINERPYTPTSDTLWLFWMRNNFTNGIARIYSAQIYDGSTPTFRGIPARRNSDGKVGIYDTVNNRFLENSGTGEFIAGPTMGQYMPHDGQ